MIPANSRRLKPAVRWRYKIRSALRRVWWFSPQRSQALKAAKVGKMYRCAGCGKLRKKVQVDHIVAVGSTDDWNGFMDRLFCEVSGLQCLCKTCHHKKTHGE